MLSGADEGAQGAPFESYKLAAVRLAEAVRLASRGNDSENDLVLELSGAVNIFLRESRIALAFRNTVENLEGVPNFGLEFSELTTDGFAKDLQALPPRTPKDPQGRAQWHLASDLRASSGLGGVREA